MTASKVDLVLNGIVALLLVLLAGMGWALAQMFGLDLSLPGRALLGLDRVEVLWFVTRAAGLVAYLLLWLSTVWGLAVSSKIFDPLLHRAFTYDMHQFISLLAIGFTALHVVVLVADQYLPFSVAQTIVPFIAPYRPLWVGIGQLALYLTLLVTLTFYARQWIGQKAFRAIHLFSFLGFAGAALHGLFAGTDSPLAAVRLMYALTTLAVVFMSVYWFLVARYKPAPVAPVGERARA